MKVTHLFTAALLGIAALVTVAQASTDFGGARYYTQPDATHTKATKGTIRLDDTTHQVSFTDKGEQIVALPYADITSMQMEKSLNRLRVPFSHKVQHQEFLTIQYRTGNGKQQYAVFQLNGRSYRQTVAALEAQSNKPIVWKAD